MDDIKNELKIKGPAYLLQLQKERGDKFFLNVAAPSSGSILPKQYLFAFTPELVEEIYIKKYKNFIKSGGWHIIRKALGEGLLTSEEPIHLHHRRILNPAFHINKINSYLEKSLLIIKEETDKWLDKEFIDKCIPLVRESLKFLDIIFFLPITKAAPVSIIENGTRETDSIYVNEIDSLFKSLNIQYKHNLGKTPFFPAEDCPGIIEILGSPFERVQMIKWYLNKDGELVGGDVNDPSNLFNPQNLEAMADLLKTQKQDLNKEVSYKSELKKIKDFVKKTKR